MIGFALEEVGMQRLAMIRRLFVLLLVVLGTVDTAAAQTPSLKILLTNDDGFEAAGLRILRDGLVAAGHQVTVSAPARDFSSAGASMTSGVIKIADHGSGIWSVEGTPADSAMVGLFKILRDSPPDLVVSGTNRGQNMGTGTNTSGTVGAAVTASNYGFPSIAVSAGISGNADVLTAAYQRAADVTVQVIAALDRSRPAGGKLLAAGLVLNINQPAIATDQLKGVRFAKVSKKPSFTRRYSDTPSSDEVRAQLVPTQPGDETDTDLALFSAGYTTISLLDGDWGVPDAAAAATFERLAGVSLRTPAAAAGR